MLTHFLIQALEPRAVMTLGAIFAFLTMAMLLVQAHYARAYRNTLTLVSAAMGSAGLSLVMSVALFEDMTAQHTLLVLSFGTGAYLLGMWAMILMYRPFFPRAGFIVAVLVCVLGYVIWPSGFAARYWNNLCQFLLCVAAAGVILRSRDPLAPTMRWLSIALCVVSALGMLPRLVMLVIDPAAPGAAAPALDTPAYRIRCLIWAVTPLLVYACITGVIHSRIARRLKNSADLDVLTGAHSRRYLFETGEQILSRQDKPGQAPATLLLIDVDHFKRFNDTWGHALGDNVLRHCVSCIREVVRADDAIIGRYGGEEFCVLLPSVAPEAASQLAERIRKQIAHTPYQHGELALPITVSIGVAHHAERGNMTAMLSQADERLYRAKHSGRNRVIDQGGMLLPV